MTGSQGMDRDRSDFPFDNDRPDDDPIESWKIGSSPAEPVEPAEPFSGTVSQHDEDLSEIRNLDMQVAEPAAEYRPAEPHQLELEQDEVRLPWLEADDDSDLDSDGARTSQILGLALLSLVALAIIIGGIWWASRRADQSAQVADGSTIAAPAAPYKEAPKDPGGKTFEGTGDTSFAVSEGQTRPARLDEKAAPQPSVDLSAPPAVAAGAAKPVAAAPAGAKAPAAAAPVATAVATGVGVQVGAFSSRSAAETAWSTLSGRHDALSGLRHRVIEGQADIGTVYRLQAVTADAATASNLCSQLKSSGLACQVKR